MLWSSPFQHSLYGFLGANRGIRSFLVAANTSLSVWLGCASPVSAQEIGLAKLQGFWAQVEPLGEPVRFVPVGKDRLEGTGLSFVAGPATVMISSGEFGSDVKIAGAGSFICYYKYLPFKSEAAFQWVFRGGNDACPKSALFKQVDVPSEQSNPATNTAIVVPPVSPPPKVTPLLPEPDEPKCGYYAIAYCSEDRAIARGVSSTLQAQLIDTNARSTYPNFRAGWYCVGAGPYSRSTAQSVADGFKKRGYPTAYFKNSC